jgi:hypothetical protein
MPLFRLKVLGDQVTNLSADRVSWGWGVEAANVGVFDALPAIIEGFELAMGGVGLDADDLGHRMQEGFDFRSIEVFPAAGGEAVAIQAWTVPYSPGRPFGSMPAEVALVLSHRIPTARGIRPKCRTYLGPFNGGENFGRPSANLISAVLRFGGDFHDALVAEGITPTCISANGLVNRGAIVGYGCDDAWDTQRRRGWDLTGMTTVGV